MLLTSHLRTLEVLDAEMQTIIILYGREDEPLAEVGKKNQKSIIQNHSGSNGRRTASTLQSSKV